jgi:hypothetical protein
MKIREISFAFGLAFLLLTTVAAPAIDLTTDTTIGPLDTGYDGTDIVISNCTVTVDGWHSFNSLLITNGGSLTHTYLSSGNGALYTTFTNEPLTLTGTNPVTLLNSNVSSLISLADVDSLIFYTNDVDFVQYSPGDGTTQIYRTETSSIPDGATVLATYTTAYAYVSGLFLTISNDLTVAAGGSINVSGAGYGPGQGVGHGFMAGGPSASGSGAGHGGAGGISSSNAAGGVCYDLPNQPASLGSGGGASYVGAGGSGGGRIQITAGGTVSIDGLVSANGTSATNSRAGGGAGGAIWIVATNYSGGGTLTVNGGAGEPIHGGGGGGGMISVQCATNLFTGTMTAYGGSGWRYGGAGTIFTQADDLTAFLLVDNNGHAGTDSTFPLSVPADFLIRNGASVRPNGSFQPRHLTIGTNAVLTGTAQSLLNMTISGNLTVQSGGAILLDTLGYAPGTGSGSGSHGANSPFPGGGGGYGGIGGIGSTNANGGASYGSQTSPTTYGSGGGGNYSTSYGGAGGGAVQLNISGTLQVDGKISANGGDGSGTGGGGGAGGSIYLSAFAVSGAGSISANGGNGVTGIGGGGGGGRIAITAGSSTFSGSISAAGGSGANYGGAGTIFTAISGDQQLILDNAGNRGTNTPVTSASSATLVIRNGARATSTSSLIFNHLLINSNGWLVHVPGGSLNLSLYGNATIQPGGGFMGDASGRGSGQGSAYGAVYYLTAPYVYYVCGGGSYGGRGGNSVSNYAAGGTGTIGDTAASPSSSYSGSGGGGNSSSFGGYGGGFLQMTVSGTLQNDGIISANGGNGYGVGGGGGGAGGGIYLTAGTLTGSGVISANGGIGANSLGGGGGGGRIAVYFNSNNFTGTLSTFGGGGANWGGAGTIFVKTNSASRGQVIADNGGHQGAGTVWSSSLIADLTLRNGSALYTFSSINLGNLVIGTNSWLIASNAAPSSMTINAANITVQSGGGISANMSGYNANSSYSAPASYYGSGIYYQGGGGGHGGAGGYGLSGLGNGGGTFDSSTSPTYAGGGGGGYSPVSIGGKGGGAISLSVTGTLQVDGTLSANGGNGGGNGGGGGAGGSLKLSCATLSGTGSIAANGGNGVDSIGGGGGGGMIYASFNSNSFSGNLSAYGGGGYTYGGAGTIYFRTNTTGQTLLIVDNGGHRGTNTPLPSANHLILRNGATAYQTYPPQTISSLLITSNAWLIGNTLPGNNYPGIVNLTVNGNATIQAGGGIYTDASGSPQNVGNGHGGYSYATSAYPCSGGAHGGYGAVPAVSGSYVSSTPVPYDSTTAPTYSGSGGGGYTSGGSIGGSGGGYVSLTVNGTLQLDGTITANGGTGTGNGGGGGSGGGIYLTVAGAARPGGAFSGSGSITANGGNGATYGGGGGGGRIVVYFDTNNFSGSLSAFGGGGYAYGGAGTIYTSTNQSNYGTLLLDNNNNPGTNTSFDFNNYDVTVQNRAIGQLPSSGTWSPHTILIRTNGALVAAASSNLRTVNAFNLNIEAGGALSLDSAGHASSTGPGSSSYGSPTVHGGAGHGGFGGGNGVNYGKAYDSVSYPTQPGSGGGGYSSGNGGYGGGALNLYVSSTLTVNGRLSANGGDGMTGAGGGSGGSLNLVSIGQLAGSGLISANGGATTGSAGGGAGGRIALTCNSNNFTGQIAAAGGNGLFPGGAGTVYTAINGVKTLTVDNGGIAGTNTPLDNAYSLPSSPFDLNIAGAAKVVPITPLPLVSNLNLAAGSAILAPAARSNLVIAVSHNANLAGSINLDSLGYAQANGPGAGTNISLIGSGGGYGGAGGNSANGAPGGGIYGSASQPTDFGSGGGRGANTLTGGSEGGGALRLSVGGTLNLDGTLSADGNYGWQDDSGGGAGGSLWITANTLTGSGNISAAGGDGDLWNGGGGGGGRIAIYAPTNLFSGTTNAGGGFGAWDGADGTIFLSSAFAGFQVLSQSPAGIVSNVVSAVDLVFNEALDPASLSATTFALTTPAGVSYDLSVSLAGPNIVHVSFLPQNQPGNYALQILPTLTNIFGQSLLFPYTGDFTIVLPTISGTVSDTNGAPVAGVAVQPDGGLIGATTDTNGAYSIGVPTGWNGTVTPSLATLMFVPGSLAYTNVTDSLANQNYLMVPTVAPSLASSLSGTNLSLGWTGISGVTYQAQYSTNLVDWLPYGDVIPGTNGPMQLDLPLGAAPSVFFRLNTAH